MDIEIDSSLKDGTIYTGSGSPQSYDIEESPNFDPIFENDDPRFEEFSISDKD